jgi:hypothetical protein
MNPELVRIYNYKNKQLYNLYYNKSKNEFYVKKSENTNFCIPLRWKYVHRKYINKKDNESKYKVYRYVHFYNPETKEKIRVTELINDSDKVIEDNLIKEEVNNMPLEEIWNRILESIANYNTTENLIDYYNENNNENNIENISEITHETHAVTLHLKTDPSPPVSPLTLPDPVIPTNTEK